MKTISNILVTIFVVLFLLSFGMKSEAVGQCPPGATSSITTTFTIKGCEFRVTICWKCGFASAPLEFGITSIEPVTTCNPYVSEQEAQDSIENELLTPPWLYLFCFTDVPPCSTGTTRVIVKRYSCFKKVTPPIVPPNPPAPTRWEVCSYDSYCKNEYEICISSLGTMDINSVTGWVQVGIPECSPMDPIPVNPPAGYSSDCWEVNPGCEY